MVRTGGWIRVYAILFLIFLYAPIVLLPVFALNSSRIIAFPLKGFTLDWFRVLWHTEALHEATANSLFIAVLAAVFATLLGTAAARAAVRYNFPGKVGIIGFILLPLMLPEIIVGVSLLVLIVQLGLTLSLWTIIAGHVLICIPFSVAILSSAFRNLDPDYEEASRDLGETALVTFLRVTLPMILPAVISSLLICFIISFDEFIIAFFLAGTEPTLPIYIWGQLRFPGKLPSVMALGMLLLVGSIILLVCADYIRRRSTARRQGDVL